MSKMYFIHKTRITAPKNKLDEALQKAYSSIVDRLISEENLPLLDKIFEDTVAAYKATGGRVQPWKYSRYKAGSSLDQYKPVFIHISDSCSLYLSEIRGELTPF